MKKKKKKTGICILQYEVHVYVVIWLTPLVAKKGLSCLLGIAYFVPTEAKFFGVIFWPYNQSFIDQACSVKMAVYWPCSFFRFHGPQLLLGP